MSVLIAYGAHLLSLPIAPSGSPSGYIAPSGFLSAGTAPSGHPATNLCDGVGGSYCYGNEITISPAIDLGRAATPDLAALFFHNIDGTVSLQGSNSSNFSSIVCTVSMTPAQPHFWVDLRSVGSRTARYWRAAITGNSEFPYVGEFVLATVTSLRMYQWGYTDTRAYLERMRGSTPSGRLYKSPWGIEVRARQIEFRGPDVAVGDVLSDVGWTAGRQPWPVLVVPDDTETDVWLVEWQSEQTEVRVLENHVEVTVQLTEQSGGLPPPEQ